MEPRVTKIPFAFSLSPAAFLAAYTPNDCFGIWQCSQNKEIGCGFARHESGRYSVVVLHPPRIFSITAGHARLEVRGSVELDAPLAPGDDPFALIERHFPFTIRRTTENDDTQRPKPTAEPFFGGLFGFVGYDTGAYFERIAGARSMAGLPDIFLMEAATFLIFDRDEPGVTLVTYPDRDAGDTGELERTLRALAANPPPPTRPREGLPPAPWAERFDRGQFISMVERAKEYIRAGDVFQVVLANTFASSEQVDSLALFDELVANNPSPYHYLIRFGRETYVGASPECMLRGGFRDSENVSVRMRLVAGTYPKGVDPVAQTSEAYSLEGDSKERAEHLMLVDHVRNDIGRVSTIGTVEVADLFSVESYADVHHLVSQVSGTLRPGEGILSALRSCFPIATLTGTPKIRAMEIIAELEGASRGIFGGAVVALGYDSSIDSAVAIRSLLTGPGGTEIRAGAGIVYDSLPAREFEECRWKAKALFDAADRCRTDPALHAPRVVEPR